MMLLEAKQHTSFLFLFRGLIHSDTVTFDLLFVALTTQQECIAISFI